MGLIRTLVYGCVPQDKRPKLDFQGLGPSSQPGHPQGRPKQTTVLHFVYIGTSICVEQSAQRRETTIAKVDERHASRPSDFTTRVARSKTAIELMNESGKSRCAEFTELLNGDFQKSQPHQPPHKRGCKVRQDIYEKVGFNLRNSL